MGYVVRVLSDFCEKIEISTKYGGEKIEKKIKGVAAAITLKYNYVLQSIPMDRHYW